MSQIIPIENVGQRIFIIRGLKVMLDSDLAELYQVPTKRLNEQVKRNLKRFPPDFMFQLTDAEVKNLRPQIATSSDELTNINRSQFATGPQKHRNPRFMPYVFTEHGVAMLAAVLKSPRAVQMSVFIVRAFVKLRELLVSNKDLAYRIALLEKEQGIQGENIGKINEQLKKFTSTFAEPKGSIGFKA